MKNTNAKILKKILAEKEIKKIAEDKDLNQVEDLDQYSEEVFNKLLSSIKINGLED